MDISVIRGDCCNILVSGSAESRDSGLSLDEEGEEGLIVGMGRMGIA